MKKGTDLVPSLLSNGRLYRDCFFSSCFARRRARRRRFTALMLPSSSVISERRCKYLTTSLRCLFEIMIIRAASFL